MNTLFDVAGKVVLVTGGAQGLGRMIAAGFVTAGAKVYITSRKAEVGAQTARDLSAVGECHALVANLSSPEAAVSLAEDIKSREQRLDILVNNAGKTWRAIRLLTPAVTQSGRTGGLAPPLENVAASRFYRIPVACTI
jgi:NAD(P)-dependent dehydrogenase (short-subunit alcohol dehydrogenase family)